MLGDIYPNVKPFFAVMPRFAALPHSHPTAMTFTLRAADEERGEKSDSKPPEGHLQPFPKEARIRRFSRLLQSKSARSSAELTAVAQSQAVWHNHLANPV
jgi:hypothetical protein